MSTSEEELPEGDPIQDPIEPSEREKKRKRYEQNQTFQSTLASQLPWAKPIPDANGDWTQVRCIVCTQVNGQDKILLAKLDTLCKHAGWKRAMVDIWTVKRGEVYHITNNEHQKNERSLLAGGVMKESVHQLLNIGALSSDVQKKFVVRTYIAIQHTSLSYTNIQSGRWHTLNQVYHQ
ncbi:unnamed protein product [Calypogeia fissa]